VDGLHAWCKECCNGSNYKNKYTNDLWVKYGITEIQYYRLLESQNNACAICGRCETKSVQGVVVALSVDHDHYTGKVRGLLCSKCNFILGNAEDNIETLESAINYLKNRV
jgi:hypothetical protein